MSYRVSWELEGSHGNFNMSYRVSWELEGSHGRLVICLTHGNLSHLMGT